MNLQVFILSSLAIIAAAFVGGLIPLVTRWRPENLRLFLGFSSGVLLGATFFHLLPEAAEKTTVYWSHAFLGGLLFLFIMEKFVAIHACEIFDCEAHTLGIAAFFGFSLHSLIDGIALGASWAVPALTPLVTFAILAHKAPTSLALSTILTTEKYSRRTTLVLVLIFALMIPLGAILSSFVFLVVPPSTIGYALAFSGGTFLHLAVSDTLPEVHRLHGARYPVLLSLLLGLGAMLVAPS